MPSLSKDFRSLLESRLIMAILTLIVVVLPLAMYIQGRNVICPCGFVSIWAGDIWGAQNSQQVFDPYTFTHVQHGIVFFILLFYLFKKLSFKKIFLIAVIVEVFWELIENSSIVIDMYRKSTISQGYVGDSIVNSVFDVVACIFGFFVARVIGVKRAVILFVIIEILMLIALRDSLLLNILMLFFPSQNLLRWQMGG